MKFEIINRKFTETVAQWMAKGYMINTATMGGSQGEIGKVDLTDGKEIIRVLLDNFSRPCEKIGEHYYELRGAEIITGRVTDKVIPNSPDTWSHIWNQNLEILKSEKFYEIGRAYNSDDKWYGTMEEAIAQQDKANARYSIRHIQEDHEVNEAAKEIVLPFIRRQPKCKSVRASEIESITKRHVQSAAGKRYTKYSIKVRGQVFGLH